MEESNLPPCVNVPSPHNPWVRGKFGHLKDPSAFTNSRVQELQILRSGRILLAQLWGSTNKNYYIVLAPRVWEKIARGNMSASKPCIVDCLRRNRKREKSIFWGRAWRTLTVPLFFITSHVADSGHYFCGPFCHVFTLKRLSVPFPKRIHNTRERQTRERKSF